MKPSSASNGLVRVTAFVSTLLLLHGVNAQSVLALRAESGPPNALALAAAKVGPRQCLADLTSISAIGAQGTTGNDVLIDWDRQRSGSSSLFSLVGLEFPKGNAALSVTAVPEADGSCSIAAERISFAPSDCKTVARLELAGDRMTRLLGHVAVYADAKDPGSSVTLIDSAPGCLVVRRYVKFASRMQVISR